MTIFVLFANDIKLMTLNKFAGTRLYRVLFISIAISIINNNYVHYLYADPGFATANAICLFVFIFELLANTWSKSVIQSFYPFKWDGTIHLLHLIFLKKEVGKCFCTFMYGRLSLHVFLVA